MKNIIFVVVALMSSISFAGERLAPMTDTSVPASLVTHAKSLSAKDGQIFVNVVTVFRGSAAGISSTIISISKSMEEPSSSYEFGNLLENPKNMMLLKVSDGVYKLKFDVAILTYQDQNGDYTWTPKAIELLITESGDLFSVEQL